MPFLIGRICEEFHCRPTEAVAELDELPADFVEEILEMRAYAETKALVDREAAAGRPVPTTRLAQLVMDIEFALVAEGDAG